jgi:hypothetical protein
LYLKDSRINDHLSLFFDKNDCIEYPADEEIENISFLFMYQIFLLTSKLYEVLPTWEFNLTPNMEFGNFTDEVCADLPFDFSLHELFKKLYIDFMITISQGIA